MYIYQGVLKSSSDDIISTDAAFWPMGSKYCNTDVNCVSRTMMWVIQKVLSLTQKEELSLNLLGLSKLCPKKSDAREQTEKG